MASSDWKPEKIEVKHILKAAQKWDKEGTFENFRQSLSYDVIIEGKPYPPKAICSIAHMLATGKAVNSIDFAGAKDGIWHKRLKELGFNIVPKYNETVFQHAVYMSLNSSREKRIAEINKQYDAPPKTITIQVIRYIRNPHVVAERLFLAEGNCENCKKPAPFLRSSNQTPFLEVHHKIPLSQGGYDILENTVALCPNCHREMHDMLNIE